MINGVAGHCRLHLPTGLGVQLCRGWLLAFCLLACVSGPALADGSEERPSASDTAQEVSRFLSKRCVSCHGFLAPRSSARFGRPGGGAAEKVGAGRERGVDLEGLSRNRRWVVPGVPDASPLFNAIITRQMPPSAAGAGRKDQDHEKLVALSDVQAVRAWIKSLPDRDACGEHVRATPAGLADALQTYLTGLPAVRAAHTRFLSLAHLSSGCPDEQGLRRWRAGLTYLLNSLSWQRDAASLSTVDARGLLLAFDLRDVGWTAERWDWLVDRAGGRAPFGQVVHERGSDDGREVTLRVGDVVAADRFARSLGAAAAYYRMLGVPADAGRLREAMSSAYGRRRSVDVGGVKESEITGAGRVIARHGYGARGFLWEVVDLRAGRDVKRALSDADLLRSFLYPGAQGKSGIGISRRFVFRLPNGQVGFMLSDKNGRRVGDVQARHSGVGGARVAPADLGAGAAGAAVDKSPSPNAAGLGCLACHDSGVVAFSSKLVSAPFVFSSEAPATHGSRDGWGDGVGADPVTPQHQQDEGRVRPFHAARLRALEANDPHGLSARDGGVPPMIDAVFELSDRHEGVVDVARAALELWVDEGVLRKRLESYRGPHASSVQRLRNGGLPRAAFDALARALFGPVSDGRYVSAPADENIDARPSLSLWANKAAYRVGEALVLFAQPGEDCRLTVIGVDREGAGTVLYPNGFVRDNLVKGGSRVRVPAHDAPYALRFGDAGRETFIGICAYPEVERLPLVDHDFDAQLFTVLGNYEEHLSSVFELEATAYARGRVPQNMRRRVRSRRRRAYTPKRPSWLFRDGRGYISVRAALPIDVAPSGRD